MKSLSIVHHSHLSLTHPHNSPTSFPSPFSSLSFRFLPPKPLSSSLHLSPLRASPSPSPLPIDDVSHKPQNAFTRLLQTLKPLHTVTVPVTAFFFMRLHLNPALAAAETPVSPPAESTTAETLSNKENQSAIEEKLNENPEENPDDADADTLRSLVEVKVREGEIGEAIQAIERLIDREPEELEWPLLKAHLHIHNGEHELAGEVFEDVLKRDPFRVDAYHGLLMVASNLNKPVKDFLERVEETVKSCKEQKRDLEVRDFKLLIAQIKAMDEDYSDALNLYQELVNEEPNDFRPYLCRCVVYTMLSKKDEAQEQFEKFRSLVPENHPYKEYFEETTKVFSQKLESRGMGVKSSES